MAIPTEYSEIERILEEFAKFHAMPLNYATEKEREYGGAPYMLGWVNPDNCLCNGYIHCEGGEYFQLRVLCWGVHKILGQKRWKNSLGDEGSILRSTLQDAVDWAATLANPKED